MKKYTFLVCLATLSSSLVFAQVEERNYGEVLGLDHFDVTNSKSKLRESADITNYQIETSPEKDTFTYKVNTEKTPRARIFGKSKESVLVVNREKSKITNIASVGYLDAGDGKGEQFLERIVIDSDGSLRSHTSCMNHYKTNFFGTQKNLAVGDKGTPSDCVTISPVVCDYLEQNKINKELNGKINECASLLSSVAEHQKKLSGLVKKEQKESLKVLSKLRKDKIKLRSFYDLEAETVQDVSDVMNGYAKAIVQCQTLKQKGFFAAVKEEPKKEKEDKPESSKQ